MLEKQQDQRMNVEAYEKLEKDPHMLKHVVNHHGDKEIDQVNFGMRFVAFTQTAMER